MCLQTDVVAFELYIDLVFCREREKGDCLKRRIVPRG